MTSLRSDPWSRREFLGRVTGAAGAGLVSLPAGRAGAEPPPETTRIRLVKSGLCLAPQYVAEELLRSEGFADVQYVPAMTYDALSEALPSGKADMSMNFGAFFVQDIDAGKPIVLVAGVHAGCQELFATERVRTIRDLKGRSVAVPGVLGAPQHLFVAAMASYVGLDPRRDITWVRQESREESMRLLAEGKVDAYLAFPPDQYELRARKVGHVIVNNVKDRPWSQYFCCLLGANREFLQRHPVATKRAIRAILKASSLCALEPERVARSLVDRGFTQRYDYALQTVKDIPYGRWREYDAEDTMRFWALRLREAGFIKSTPQKILAQGTDWRFLNELKKELKG